MSEAGTGNAQKLLARHQYFTIALAVVAAALWAFAMAPDRVPDHVESTILALAGTTTVLAGALAAGHLRQRITLEVATADAASLTSAITGKIDDAVAGAYRRGMADAAKQLAAAGRRTDRKMDQSEYYRVYSDVLLDLAGLGPDPDADGIARN